ncbi:MAG TPA: hypothetical protein VHC95_02275 [Opitutales bacterium]|nr:hypothetical protein [Opitutales bacterium]
MMHSEPASQTLADWLAIATGKLVPSAQARVRAEIEAHYAEALRTHLGRGLSQADAQVAALADLGDAQVAGRRFQHEFLTKAEAAGLARFNKGANGMLRFFFVFMLGFMLFGILMFFLDFYVIRHRPDAPPLWEAAALWSIVAFVCLAGFAVVTIESRQPFTAASARLVQRLRFLLRFMLPLMFVAVGLVVGFSAFFHTSFFLGMVWLVLALQFLHWLIYELPADARRLRKLRQVTDADFAARESGGGPGTV